MDVPSFEYVAREPFFVGYRLIRGHPLVDEDAVGVRAFLQALQGCRSRPATAGGFYHRLAPWYEAHYGLFTNQPAHTERGRAGISERI